MANSGCASRQPQNQTADKKGPVIVASKIDTEGALLGNMIIEMLQDNGFEVIDKVEFGPTDLIRKAIISDEIDIYPEYTGNGGFFFDDTDPNTWKNADKAFDTVKALDKEQNNLVWLDPAPANNTWAIAVRKDLSATEKIKTMEDFTAYVNRKGFVKLACSEEFVSRPDALPAFEKEYGFKLAKDQLVILAGGNTAQTEKAAAEGTDGVNFAMAYGTDGALAALELMVLEDTKGVQPVYEPAPLVRGEVMVKYPEIADILKPVFESLNLVKLQALNGKIAMEGQDAAKVAKDYLDSEGFLKK
ncbi:MAG: osmoprotectant uptake system substrate-binding protein [Candidatus Aquicultor primus]|uniref:Osmoprotectant uptake system substrate-binding protein n=1 Tax=Candidatus Aquicultor primus TaxID=1797195 RepID=A0A1F2UPT2_9ACTN|nr:MAG: osmoprotectant uptake system substrate-binding protein [Candidatus Aquicultor primus]